VARLFSSRNNLLAAAEEEEERNLPSEGGVFEELHVG
jgi:hypothetical protein